MKIAADYYREGLGRSLGFLVGALVLGTALPHLLKAVSLSLPWKFIFYATSILSVFGAVLIAIFVPDGPFRKAAKTLEITSFLNAFKQPEFRSAAIGYFGHMWELYAFWMSVPVVLQYYKTQNSITGLNTSLWSFIIIAVGSLSCAASGFIAERTSVRKVATRSLLLSFLCCLLSPVVLISHSVFLFLVFLLIWGIAVVADSPMFSTLTAANAPAASKAASLTIVNSIGFAITILSIQTINLLTINGTTPYAYLILALGPFIGLMAMFRTSSKETPDNSRKCSSHPQSY